MKRSIFAVVLSLGNLCILMHKAIYLVFSRHITMRGDGGKQQNVVWCHIVSFLEHEINDKNNSLFIALKKFHASVTTLVCLLLFTLFMK
jgi:hypothetical protein